MPIQLGEIFFSLKLFKEAMYDWALNEYFEVSYTKSNRNKVAFIYRFNSDYPWKIRATYNSKKEEATYIVLNSEYNYASYTDIKRSLASYIS
jgi:hypothetical protein